MLKTILKRVLQSIPTLFIVITITFILTRMIPGNPALTMLGPQAPKEAVEQLEEELGLNKSKGEQYMMYLKQILSGDFGKSYSYNQPVIELIMERVPNTLLITLTSLLIALVLGVMAGIISAIKQYSMLDYIFMVIALIGVSMPIFWMGLMLVLVFSVNLGWLPTMGMGDMGNGLWDVISHMILPCFCLSTIPMATFARITRSSMLEVVNNDSIRALRARGLRESVVIWKHALKNALPPIVTVLGLQLATAFTGAILTESIFAWPGMGTMIVSAIDNRDYALIQGVVLFTAIVFVVINLVVDIVYTMINPKVNYENGNGGK